MATDSLVIHLFSMIGDQIGLVKQHPLALLYPNKVVTSEILFALKGLGYRASYR